MKKIHFLLFGLTLALSLVSVSCSGDDEDNSDNIITPSALIGKWTHSNTTLVFNSDNTGYYEIDLKTEGQGVRRSYFGWVHMYNTLLLTWDGSGGHESGDFIYLYTLERGLLTVYYDDGELWGIFIKKSDNTGDNTGDNTPTGTINAREYVDLGLPGGLKWAACNVGATKPEEYGRYYAWGATEEKRDYCWDTYKWCNGSFYTLTKYCTDSNYGRVDNKTVLDLEDDVAHVEGGGSWRTPTYDEIEELINKCTWQWTTLNGVKGYMVTGPNGNSIFFPAAGFCVETELYSRGSHGSYWSSSLSRSEDDCAYYLDFYVGGRFSRHGGRDIGFSVRPVSK